MDVVIEEGVSVVLGDDPMVVAILCGPSLSTCSGVSVLESQARVSQTIVLNACDDLVDDDDDDDDKEDETSVQTLFECEKTLFAKLEGVSNIRAVFLDSSAPYELGQIILKIWSTKRYRRSMLAEDIVLLGVVDMADEWEQEWRRHFLERFRKI